MVSGKVDAQSWEADIGSDVTITECAHIFGELMNTNLNDEAEHYAASIWAVLEAFGYPNILKDLAGSKIHRLDNILTMDLRLHQYFDTQALVRRHGDSSLLQRRVHGKCCICHGCTSCRHFPICRRGACTSKSDVVAYSCRMLQGCAHVWRSRIL